MIKLKNLLVDGYIVGSGGIGVFRVVRPTIDLKSDGKKIKARKGALLYNEKRDGDIHYVDPEQKVAYKIDWENPDADPNDISTWPAFVLKASSGELLKLPAGHADIVPEKEWKKWVKKT